MERKNEVQGLLCGALQVIIQKLDDGVVTPHADALMSLFLQVHTHTRTIGTHTHTHDANHTNTPTHPRHNTQVLHSKTATVHEEALNGIGAIAARVGIQFEKYLNAFRPYLMLGLQNAAEHHVCIMTVGVVSEMSRALNDKMAPLCDDIMRVLLHNLQNPDLERSVKPHIISCLSDLSLAVGGYFERYLPFVMMMLVQASQIKLDETDYDNHDYLNKLRCGAY